MALKELIKIASISTMMAFATSVAAEGGVKIGTLSCDVDGSVGFIFGSSKNLECVFSREKGSKEHYKGTIKNFGIDIGFTKDGMMAWAVIALSSELRPGGLQGSFIGGGADVGIGLGLGANALVIQGGSNQALALQPLSIEGFEGLNAAAGIRALNLKHKPKGHH